jgi:hypothetical protein
MPEGLEKLSHLGVKKFVKRREYNCRQELVARSTQHCTLYPQDLFVSAMNVASFLKYFGGNF